MGSEDERKEWVHAIEGQIAKVEDTPEKEQTEAKDEPKDDSGKDTEVVEKKEASEEEKPAEQPADPEQTKAEPEQVTDSTPSTDANAKSTTEAPVDVKGKSTVADGNVLEE